MKGARYERVAGEHARGARTVREHNRMSKMSVARRCELVNKAVRSGKALVAPERALHERVAGSAQTLGQWQKLGDALVMEPGTISINE